MTISKNIEGLINMTILTNILMSENILTNKVHNQKLF